MLQRIRVPSLVKIGTREVGQISGEKMSGEEEEACSRPRNSIFRTVIFFEPNRISPFRLRRCISHCKIFPHTKVEDATMNGGGILRYAKNGHFVGRIYSYTLQARLS